MDTENNFLNRNDVYNRLHVIESYYKQNTVAHTNIESFNQFLMHDLKRFIVNNPILIDTNSDKISITFDNIEYKDISEKDNNQEIYYPIYIRQGKTKSKNYEFEVKCTIHLQHIDKTKQEQEQKQIDETKDNFLLLRLPIMVGSKVCKISKMSDEDKINIAKERFKEGGGYFIMNRQERFLISEVKNARNKVYILKTFDRDLNTHIYTSQIRTLPYLNDSVSSSIEMKYYDKKIKDNKTGQFSKQRIFTIKLHGLNQNKNKLSSPSHVNIPFKLFNHLYNKLFPNHSLQLSKYIDTQNNILVGNYLETLDSELTEDEIDILNIIVKNFIDKINKKNNYKFNDEDEDDSDNEDDSGEESGPVEGSDVDNDSDEESDSVKGSDFEDDNDSGEESGSVKGSDSDSEDDSGEESGPVEGSDVDNDSDEESDSVKGSDFEDDNDSGEESGSVKGSDSDSEESGSVKGSDFEDEDKNSGEESESDNEYSDDESNTTSQIKLPKLTKSGSITQDKKEFTIDSSFKETMKKYIIENTFLNIPKNDIQPENDIQQMTIMIRFMVNQLMKTIMGEIPEIDREHYENKRIDTPGMLFKEMFEKLYRTFLVSTRSTFSGQKGTTKNTHKLEKVMSIVQKIIGLDTDYQRDLKAFEQKSSKQLTGFMRGFHRAMMTGKWGKNTTDQFAREGISQVLERKSYLSVLSGLRRIMLPIDVNNKIIELRHIHTSQYGYVCPNETPEGGSVGITLNYSLFSKVSFRNDRDKIMEMVKNAVFYMDQNDVKYLKECTVLTINNKKQIIYKDPQNINIISEIFNIDKNSVQYSEKEDNYNLNIDDHKNPFLVETKDIDINKTLLFVNNILVGNVKYVKHFLYYMRNKRYMKKIRYDVSISYNDILDQIHIQCDSGRFIRPFFRCVMDEESKQNRLQRPNDKIDWRQLFEDGDIEYLDVSESTESLIAMEPDELQTSMAEYCEIHPVSQLGLISNIVPFISHLPTTRVNFETSMAKQAIGTPLSKNELKERYDTILRILEHPQKPLVSTSISRFLGLDELPMGQNVLCAIMTFGGFNQEDSIIVNKRAIKKGLFKTRTIRTITYTKELEQELKKDSTIPKLKNKNYSKLDNNGIIREGVEVKENDILFRVIDTSQVMQKDVSVSAHAKQQGRVIERIIKRDTIRHNTIISVKIKIETINIPKVGDKLASRSAQKGVIALIVKNEDMPYNPETNLTPDIIINPHAIPSRMTINQLMEMTLGNAAMFTRQRIDATAFRKINMEHVNDFLRECKLNYSLTKDNMEKIIKEWNSNPMYWKLLETYEGTDFDVQELLDDLQQNINLKGYKLNSTEPIFDLKKAIEQTKNVSDGDYTEKDEDDSSEKDEDDSSEKDEDDSSEKDEDDNIQQPVEDKKTQDVKRDERAKRRARERETQIKHGKLEDDKDELKIDEEDRLKYFENLKKVLLSEDYRVDMKIPYGALTRHMLHIDDESREIDDTDIKERVFMGYCYYQTLPHLVNEKVYARAIGKYSEETGQPVDGRVQGGGLRFGEMERDAVISHGSRYMLLERTSRVAERSQDPVPLCTNCGSIFNIKKNKYHTESDEITDVPNLSDNIKLSPSGHRFSNKKFFCTRTGCQNSEIVNIILPYASNLLLQELMCQLTLKAKILTDHQISSTCIPNKSQELSVSDFKQRFEMTQNELSEILIERIKQLENKSMPMLDEDIIKVLKSNNINITSDIIARLEFLYDKFLPIVWIKRKLYSKNIHIPLKNVTNYNSMKLQAQGILSQEIKNILKL